MTDTNVELRYDQIFVHLDRVRLCYPEQGDKVWSGQVGKKGRANRSSDDTTPVSPVDEYAG